MIDVCLLGCGGGMPMPFRYLSSVLLNIKGRKILVDCGEGTQVSMRMVGWGFKSLDLICITHIHGDHIVGLPGLLSTMGNSGRTEPLTIIGPEGISEVLMGLRVICPYLPYEINIIEKEKRILLRLNKEGIKIDEKYGDIEVSTLDVEHSSNCLGYSFYFKRSRKFSIEKAIERRVPKVIWNRLQKEENVLFEGKEYYSDMVLGEERNGIKVALITDTRPIESIVKFVEKSDLFICEGTYGDDNDEEKAIKNKHMTFREAAILAKEGDVKELLLTHFSPALLNPNEFLENATSVFQNTILGEDRLIKTLSYSD